MVSKRWTKSLFAHPLTSDSPLFTLKPISKEDQIFSSQHQLCLTVLYASENRSIGAWESIVKCSNEVIKSRSNQSINSPKYAVFDWSAWKSQRKKSYWSTTCSWNYLRMKIQLLNFLQQHQPIVLTDMQQQKWKMHLTWQDFTTNSILRENSVTRHM